MGDPPASQNPQLKRFSGRDYHSQDTSGPFEPPDIPAETSSEGRGRVERRREPQTPSQRPQTADYNLAELWNQQGGGALKRRTSWDGSPVVQRDPPAPFDGNLDIDLGAIPSTNDFDPPPEPFESAHNQDIPVNSVYADTSYQPYDDAPRTMENALGAPEAAESSWPPVLPPPPQHIRFDNVRTMESRMRSENGVHDPILPDYHGNQHSGPRSQSTEQDDWIEVEHEPSIQPFQDPEYRPAVSEYETSTSTHEFVDPFRPAAPESSAETKWDGVPIDPFPPSTQEQLVQQVDEPQAQFENEVAAPEDRELVPQIVEQPASDLAEPPEIAPGDAVEGAISVDQTTGDGFAKLLRRLRRKMDEILEKRTLWQNEQQKLERRRAFLKASMKGMKEVIEAERANGEGHGSPSEARRERSGRGRRRTGPDVSSPRTGGLSSSSASARGSHAATASDLAETAATSISFSTYGEAQTQVQEDEDRVNEQEEYMKSLGEQINNLEFHVKELVQEITKQMGSANFIDELRMDMLNMEASTQASEPEVEPEDDTPEDVRKYFDWTGEQGIQLERLQELDFDHNEGLVQREFLRDQGKVLDVSDAEHLYLYQLHRADITTRLAEARSNMDYYYGLCDAAGIDPQEYRRVPRTRYSGSISLQSRSVFSDVEQTPQINEPGLSTKRSLSPPAGGDHNPISIEAWRQNIPLESADLGMLPNFDTPTSRAP